VAQDIGADRRIARIVGGRYQITGLIASGGMGEVFQAHDKVLDRTVALKVLRAGLGSDPDFVERFRKEATTAGRLSHPNIVQVYDWGRSEDGSAYMAMELVEGQNLREVLAASGRMRPALAARIAAQVCGALEAARKAGLVHRDIKPENILLTPDGRVKVADFGLSRTMAESKATQAGVLLGTAHYIAPEQVEGKESDHRSDLYALGVVLYEMLTGTTPFTGDTPLIVAYQRVREDVPLPSAAINGIPETLDQIVRKATARDPEQRFGSAAEMGEALRTAVPRTDTGEVGMLVHPTIAIPIGTQETVNLGRKGGHRLTRRGVIVLLAVLALIAGSIPILVGAFAHVKVPSVAGLTKAEATTKLRAAGFAVTSDLENNESVPEGSVIRTDPSGGSSIRKGSTVTIVVSAGPVTVRVPDVTRMKFEDAKAKLEKLHLEVDRTDAFSGVKRGYVISQNKDPDVLVNSGTRILLTVSKGVERVLVPDVTKKSQDDATTELTAAGFTVTVQKQDSDSIPAGQVISQTPAGGVKAAKGSAVTIVVSQGPQQFPMPDVRGMSYSDAKAKLEDMGLVVKREQVPGSYGDTVVGQKPSRGQKVQRGQTVILYTS